MHVHNRASCLTGIMYFCCVPHALLSASNSHKWLYKSTLKESFVITVDADLPESTKMNISWSGPRNSKWCTRIEKYFNVWLALDFFSLLFRAGRIAPWEFFFPFSFFSWIPAESHVILLLCIWVTNHVYYYTSYWLSLSLNSFHHTDSSRPAQSVFCFSQLRCDEPLYKYSSFWSLSFRFYCHGNEDWNAISCRKWQKSFTWLYWYETRFITLLFSGWIQRLRVRHKNLKNTVGWNYWVKH